MMKARRHGDGERGREKGRWRERVRRLKRVRGGDWEREGCGEGGSVVRSFIGGKRCGSGICSIT